MLVCCCAEIASSDIENEIMNGASSVDDLIERLGVCLGCGTCKNYLEEEFCKK